MGKSQLQQHVESHLVIVFNNRTKEHGSGTFIEYNSNWYVLTAKHVISECSIPELAVSFGIKVPVNIISKLYLHSNLDIAAIQLNKESARFFLALHSNPFIIEKVVHIEAPVINDKATLPCCFAGFPIDNVNLLGDIYQGESFYATSTLLAFGNIPEKLKSIQYDPSFHAFVDMSNNQFVDQDGNPAEFNINPKGLSGASIWIYDPETENAEIPRYTLFALQSHILRPSNYLKVVSVNPLFALLDA